MKDILLPSIYAPFIPYISTANAEIITFEIPSELLSDAMAAIAKSELLRDFRLPQNDGEPIVPKIANPGA